MIPLNVEPYYNVGFDKEVWANGVYIPNRSKRIKSKQMRKRNKKKKRR